jgi:hypothetical protein
MLTEMDDYDEMDLNAEETVLPSMAETSAPPADEPVDAEVKLGPPFGLEETTDHPYHPRPEDPGGNCACGLSIEAHDPPEATGAPSIPYVSRCYYCKLRFNEALQAPTCQAKRNPEGRCRRIPFQSLGTKSTPAVTVSLKEVSELVAKVQACREASVAVKNLKAHADRLRVKYGLNYREALTTQEITDLAAGVLTAFEAQGDTPWYKTPPVPSPTREEAMDLLAREEAMKNRTAHADRIRAKYNAYGGPPWYKDDPVPSPTLEDAFNLLARDIAALLRKHIDTLLQDPPVQE